MRVFLDGATGFIGSQVARELVARGHEAIALVRPAGDRRRLVDVAHRLTCVPGTLDDPNGWQDRVAALAPEAAIHLAWDVTPGRYLESPANRDCLERSRAWLAATRAIGCAHRLIAGTSLEYAPADRPLSEDDALAPACEYARCKDALRRAAEAAAAAEGSCLTWCRLFHLYGPGEDPRRLVPAVVRALLSGERIAVTHGRQVCDYLHVADAAAAMVRLLECGVTGAVNVASGRPVSVREVITRIAMELDRPELIGWGERETPAAMPNFLVADVRRLRGRIGWRPRFGLAAGLRETIEGWQTEQAGTAMEQCESVTKSPPPVAGSEARSVDEVPA